jgi:hypothetical protein
MTPFAEVLATALADAEKRGVFLRPRDKLRNIIRDAISAYPTHNGNAAALVLKWLEGLRDPDLLIEFMASVAKVLAHHWIASQKAELQRKAAEDKTGDRDAGGGIRADGASNGREGDDPVARTEAGEMVRRVDVDEDRHAHDHLAGTEPEEGDHQQDDEHGEVHVRAHSRSRPWHAEEPRPEPTRPSTRLIYLNQLATESMLWTYRTCSGAPLCELTKEGCLSEAKKSFELGRRGMIDGKFLLRIQTPMPYGRRKVGYWYQGALQRDVVRAYKEVEAEVLAEMSRYA